jgi:hypothetical protein
MTSTQQISECITRLILSYEIRHNDIDIRLTDLRIYLTDLNLTYLSITTNHAVRVRFRFLHQSGNVTLKDMKGDIFAEVHKDDAVGTVSTYDFQTLFLRQYM